MSDSPPSATAWASHLKADRLRELRHESLSRGSPQQRAYLTSQLFSDSMELLHVAHDLQRLANATSTIHSLPTELLLHIIAHLARMEPAVWQVQGGFIEEKELGYLRVSQVCHRWRDICLVKATASTHQAVPSLPKLISGTVVLDSLRRVQTWAAIVPCITILRGLKKLRISDVKHVEVVDIMAILAHAPSLEIVELRDCGWEMYKPQTNFEVTLRQLRRLRITSSSFQHISFDPSEWFFEHILAPTTVNLQLTHHLQYDSPTDNGRHLGRLVRSTVERLWSSDQSLSLGVDRLSLTLDVIEEPMSREVVNQQVKLETPQISFVFMALEDSQNLQVLARIRLFSSLCDKEMWIGSQEVDSLGRHLRHIEFLHVRAPAYEHHQPLGLFPRLADTVNDEIIFPQLQQLSVIPARLPRGSLRLDAIAELLRRRLAHHGNKLQYVHLDVPRPTKRSKDVVHASAIEEIVPVVVWRTDELAS
ncbi:unnamed protein product [Peniophora sp. CBMAI 1063]|nr:unnamed protein product [Peniophora sp. CBMAI 1063]